MEINSDAIERVVMAGVAKDILHQLTQEERDRFLRESLQKTLKDCLSVYKIHGLIKDDIMGYAAEYLKRPGVQAEIKLAAEAETAKLIQGIVRVIIHEAQEGIKSKYNEFLKKPDCIS